MKNTGPFSHLLFRIFTSLAVLGFSSFIHAALEFEKTTVERNAKPEDTELLYQFKFKVTGDAPVIIKEFRALCDCLQIDADRKIYQTGETGIVTVKLQIGTFEGTLVKSFNVITDNAKDQRTLLRCVANLPKVFEISALVTSWNVEASPDSKTVSLKILAGDPMGLKAAKVTGNNVAAILKEIEPGRSYEIKLTPNSTAKKEIGLVSIETTSSIKKYARCLIYFNILPDRTASKKEIKSSPPEKTAIPIRKRS